MVLYIFEFPAYVKLGLAKRCPYERLQRGFWHNRHPPELCNRLDDVRLLHMFEGGLAEEQALHSALGPCCGEFYASHRLPELLSLIRCMLEELPLPPEPPVRLTPDHMKSGCCKRVSGLETDQVCNRPDHEQRSLATRGKKAPCQRCGKLVSVRHDKLKQHQKSRACV